MSKYVLWVFFGVVFLSCTDKKEKILPTVTDITESVYSSITIQPDSLYQAYASVHGILDNNLVEEGDDVKKETPILQIVNSNPKLNTENAKLSFELAQKNYSGSAAILSSIEEEIKSATLKMTNDSINYCRQKNLWSQQIGSKLEYDTKKLAYELSSNSLGLLRSKYDRTEEELQTQLKQAKNNYRTSVITTKDFTINSKINGKVYALYKNPGEIVNTVEPLAAIGSATVFVIEMLVDEVDIVKIKKSQKVIITLDAYNGKVFTAIVSKIYPKKDERNQTFMVEALFEKSPEVLYPGLSGEANIIIARKKEVLTVPKEYLIEDHKVKTEKGVVKITIGLQSMDTVEVLSGITKDTWIYKPE
ncbi:multidrug efflux pump subunit AcrA (membrane-fusion protein) [Aquimarina sp. MAR_2010_214]|uniref:efflux RND transporter periplasmic adaptor subunit n=1 Tax=Aquimarina sp. MAR_2010_214 TaxID=1250026 RepID=UPI000C70F204|nr:HlyD family efflux transporter periplasmic adaptor subunit [Aquimarina sp. MAR_2010_214]PKV48355.1 multidrug efflux pump subunit AcrA (membrane-fusion protein) [Aquimarina sp. MAR_2010_214]